MSETLYRKYRPSSFSEVIGQTHIVRTLSNAVTHSRIGQAYLFTGPRGTGKTSIARILAKTVNCENIKDVTPCEKCNSCNLISDARSLDIIEIDAASNTGVDNIRELRETVALPPTSLKYKVYIIDEVHMLSTGAFNALLKTLEEPPAHVIFILATTEIHKVPETIISRCQRFDFSRLPLPQIIEKLSLIAKAEKVKIEKEALEMIAIAAEGGMRDAESLLGQIISLEDKNITAKEVEEIIGATDKKVCADVARMIMENDTESAIGKINMLLADGYDLQVFSKSLVNYLRQLMLLKVNDRLSEYFAYEMTGEQLEEMKTLAQKSELVKIISAMNLVLDAQIKIPSFILPQLPLEIAIIKATKTFPSAAESIEPARNISPARQPDRSYNGGHSDTGGYNVSDMKPGNNSKIENDEENESESQITDNELPQAGSNIKLDINLVKNNWNKLLNDVKPYNHSLNALLSNCQVMEVAEQNITIATPYDFYKERLNENSNKLTVEKVFSSILGLPITIIAVINRSIIKRTEIQEDKKESKQDPLLSSALEIMGGKIVE